MNWLIKLIIEKILDYIGVLFRKEIEAKQREKQQDQSNKELLDKYNEAVSSGDKAKIAQAAEDLLNGKN
jgi:hypothetical protein